jgi:hypothetical protein
MHLDNLLFILLIVMAALFRLLASKAREPGKKTQQPTQKPTVRPQLPEPARRAPVESDEERIRRFLEALGQPVDSRPPPPVVPHIDIPPRPLARIQPPALPTARNILIGKKPRRAIKARKAPAATVFEEYETAAPLEAPHSLALGSAAAYATAPRTEFAGREDKVNIVTLLRSQSGLRNAILLREIFGPPRSLQPLDLVQIA